MINNLVGKTVVFIDLDSTLIKTITRRPYASYIADNTPIWKTWNALKSWVSESKDEKNLYILIVSNQGGIETGKGSSLEYMNLKFSYIRGALQEYVDKNRTKTMVDYIFCSSNSETDHMRKPNTGMLEAMINRYSALKQVGKNKMIMVGDASGRPGDFSDSDLKVAQNFGIDYLDVDDI